MDEISNIFNTTAFPVAVCVVLFYILFCIVRMEMKQNREALQIVKEANDKHILYIEKQNQQLTQIISECTKALNENTSVYKKLLFVLEQRKTPD